MITNEKQLFQRTKKSESKLKKIKITLIDFGITIIDTTTDVNREEGKLFYVSQSDRYTFWRNGKFYN